MARPHEVLHGAARIRLIHELALGVKSTTELAAEFGTSQPNISQFGQRHSLQVAAARDRIEDEFRGLWIADKLSRLAEYEDDVDRINSELDEVDLADRPKFYAAKRFALRNVAEELGQLAPRAYDVTTRVHYSIEGVDMDALR